MQVPQEVLAVLSDLDVAGTQVRIATQLDRKTYTKVNKVLEAIGGKWSRKAKAHVFGSDAQPRLDLVMTTGTVETGQDVGWFPTPGPLARRLVEMAGVQRREHVLEPSAGEGAIVDAIAMVGAFAYAVERDPERRRSLVGRASVAIDCDDFMCFEPPDEIDALYDRVVMNPPFCKVGKGDHLDHVRHAFGMLRAGGVLVSVMPSSVSFRRDRRYAEFRAWVEKYGTIEPLPEGSFKESGTGVNTCVVRVTR